jgi:hypothetical protein
MTGYAVAHGELRASEEEGTVLTPAIFQEMGRIRARSLRDDARGGGAGRGQGRRRGVVRNAVGTRLVSVGLRMMRGVA